jgi:ribulose-5-phosphate 4-epimerase/fuculose-1-phosphate aldolase
MQRRQSVEGRPVMKSLDICKRPAPSVAGGFEEQEWALRVELAAFYRAMVKFGLTDLIYNHITAKVPGGDEHFLINPYGLHYSEITASCFYKIDITGNVIFEPPSYAQFGVNSGGFTIHSAVHAARPDVACVVHTHSRAGMALAATDEILLPLTQHSMLLYGNVSYHEYGVPGQPEEGEAMVRSLGKNNFMVLRNHGLLVCGPAIPATFLATYWFEQACKTQVDLMMMHLTPKLLDHDLATSMAARFMQQDGQREWEAVKRILEREDASYAT